MSPQRNAFLACLVAAVAFAVQPALSAPSPSPPSGGSPGARPPGGPGYGGSRPAYPGRSGYRGYGGSYGHHGHSGHYGGSYWGWGLAYAIPWGLGWYGSGAWGYPYYPSYAYGPAYPAYGYGPAYPAYGYSCAYGDDCWRTAQAEPTPESTVVPPPAPGEDGGPTQRPLHLNYCDSAKAWFPHVRSCPGGWRLIRPEYNPAP